MPMFPLGMTLLPGSLLPLHVFEPRYVQMVHDLLASDVDPPAFGVVMIERGREVGGGDVRADVATLAIVRDIQALPGGRYQLVASGDARIRVTEWRHDEPYPRADGELWADEGRLPDDIATEVERLHQKVLEINALARDAGQEVAPDETTISPEPGLAIYHLAALSPIGATDRYRLLRAPSVAERCSVLDEVLDDARAVLDFGRT